MIHLHLSHPEKFIIVLVDKESKKIMLDEILYCKADKDYTLIYLYNPKKPDIPLIIWKASGYLLRIIGLLDLDSFSRIHDSYYVNLMYYDCLYLNEGHKDLHIENNVCLPVSKRKLGGLRRTLRKLKLKK
jgi:DNA-binding LytR/AlgR family response regulator